MVGGPRIVVSWSVPTQVAYNSVLSYPLSTLLILVVVVRSRWFVLIVALRSYRFENSISF